MSREALIAMGRDWLANSPAVAPPGNPELRGWSGPAGYVCSQCAGRIMARGCDFKQLAASPVWIDSSAAEPCALCGDEPPVRVVYGD